MFQHIDFSPPLIYAGLRIYSGQPNDYTMGDVFSGVFDGLSSASFMLAAVAMAMVTSVTMPNYSLAQATLRVLGNVFGQGLYTSNQHPTRRISQAFLGLFIMYNFLVTTVYKSTVISLITAKRDVRAIEDLDDLLRDEFKHVR